MRLRTASRLLASGLFILLASCSTTRGGLKLDWQALEQQQRNSAPLGLYPEAELFQARIPLIQVQATTVSSTGGDAKARTTFPTSPFGISCGNGLSIDTEGNLFLDLMSLLKVDTRGTFRISYNLSELIKTADTFQYRPLGALPSSVTVSAGGGLMVRVGPIEWGYTIEDGTYRYMPGVPLLAGYDMTAGPDSVRIVAHKLIPVTQLIALKNGEIHFPGKYRVSKQGDTYTIRTDELLSRTYKLYYAPAQILFCEGDTIVKNVLLTPGQVLVNGEKLVAYQAGG